MITICWLRLHLPTWISEGKRPPCQYRFDDVLLDLPDVKVLTMWISSWLTMIFWKVTSLLSFSNAFFWAAFRTESRAPSISIIFKRRQTSLKQSRRISSNTRTRRSIYFVFTRRWTVPLRLLSLADKLLTAITQACPISCGMQKQIGRRWYHREAVCLSSSLSGCSPGSQ